MMPIRLDRENNARNRCLSADEEAVLMDSLPEWLRPMIMVALNTGMRLGELRALRWEDVDEKTSSIRVRRDKAGEGRWVVMNSAVQEALLVIRRERKVLGAWVFCSPEGKYLHNFERYWRPAVQVAAIPDFRFHDTFASRLAMTPGVDLYTIQKAGSWKTPIMVQRYAHLSPGPTFARPSSSSPSGPSVEPAREPAPIGRSVKRGVVEVRDKIWCAWQESNLRPSD